LRAGQLNLRTVIIRCPRKNGYRSTKKLSHFVLIHQGFEGILKKLGILLVFLIFLSQVLLGNFCLLFFRQKNILFFFCILLRRERHFKATFALFYFFISSFEENFIFNSGAEMHKRVFVWYWKRLLITIE